VIRTRPAALAGLLTLVAGCASPPPPAAPAPTYEQKLAWILRLEDRRVLRDPAPPVPVAPALGGSRRPAAPAAVPDLLQLLGDASSRVRRRAALAIGRVGLPEGIEPLAQVLAGDAEPEVRQMAAFALGLTGDARGAAALTTALGDGSPMVQGRAAEALGQIGAKDQAPAIAAMARRYVAEGVLRTIAPDDLTYPMPPEVEAVRLALYALCRLQAYDALASVALDQAGEPVSRWWPIAYAFGRSGDARAAGPLTKLLAGEGQYTRAFAARGIGHVKAADSGRVLVPLVLHVARDPIVGVEAIRSAVALGTRAAAPALLEAVQQPSLPSGIRAEAVSALGALGTGEDAERLLDLLSDPAPPVRAAAFGALARLDPARFLMALSGLDPDRDWRVRAAIATALGTLPPDQGLPLLTPMLRDEDQRTRPAVLAALARARAPDAEAVLIEHLAADDVVVRAAAAAALGDLRAPAAVEPLRAALTHAERDATYVARAAILAALAKYDRAVAEPALVAALADKDWAVRVRAAELLKTIDPSRETAMAIRPAPTMFSEPVYAAAEVVTPPYSTRVYVDTDKGSFEIELAVLDAPLTVHSFAALARKGYFDGLAVHRVVPGFVVQDGDPRGDGEGGPGYTIRNEINQRPYLRGTVGMALDWADTGGSQYFITHGPQPHLDGRYTVFGQIVAGMEVVDRLEVGDVVRRMRVWDGVQ
jgi:HEAT repeat protein/cyclophilin family peptidyl-prolyl cis-trans isomerase